MVRINPAAVIVLTLCIALTACGPSAVATPTPEPTQAAASTPTETVVLTPTEEPTSGPPFDQRMALVIQGQVTYRFYIHLTDPATMRPVRLLEHDPDLGDGDGPWHLTWSPDGQALAYVYGYSAEGGNITETWLYTADLSGTERLIYHSPEFAIGQPSWSADSRRIAAAVNYVQGFNYPPEGVWLFDPAQEEAAPMRLDEDGADYGLPAWSPVDANTLALVSDREGSYAIYTVDFSGPSPVFTRLAGLEKRPSQLVWSPDGTRLVFDQIEEGVGSNLTVLDTATGATSPFFTNFTGFANQLRFSPDGARVAFQGNCGPDPLNSYVCVYSISDASLSPLAAVSRFVKLDWSADGEWILRSGIVEDSMWVSKAIRSDGSGEEILFPGALDAFWQPLP